jgi:hypothetical protein
MKYQKTSSKILLILLAIGITLGIYIQVRARQSHIQVTPQQDIVSYLEERYKQQNVPVVSITVLNQAPLSLEILFQSGGEKRGTPDDPINFHLVEREVILAQQKGYVIESFTIITLNKFGEQAAKVHIPVHTEYMILDNPPAKISDSITKNLVSQKINPHGMTIENMNVSSFDGIQTLSIQLSTSSFDEAKQTIPIFIDSLRSWIKGTNALGAQIQVLQVQLRDEKGNILLNYMSDSQLRSENWWNADNFPFEWGEGPPTIATP